jgi:ATP-dependent Clp protease ATP-binding subunit ClpC
MWVKIEIFFLGAAAAFMAMALWWRRVFRRARGSMNGYNFTQRVREALAAARNEAGQLGHEFVGTEHILLGLLSASPGVAVAVLDNLNVDSKALRASTIALAPAASGRRTGPDLPYTSRSKKALELSMAVARELSHNYVGTEHMLLGLIREQDGVAAQALANAGVTFDNARVQALRATRKPG